MGDMADYALSTHADGFSSPKRTNKTGHTVSAFAVSAECHLCGSAMTKKTGPYGAFWGCNRFPECKGSHSVMR